MEDQHPKPHWVYRGQSTKGIGEGPGQHVAHGDQYLDASAALREVKLLEAIRPWMTLDSDPIDHERLKDGLEAWSCFRANGWQFVARLVSAGIYDRRAAYFSQGFAWSREGSKPPGLDPGLFLGQSEAFEKPWRDRDPGRHAPDLRRVESAPSMVRPRDVEGSSQAAVSFLAHLFQACVLRRPLIIAAPVAEFAAGSPLHALVSFARGALPAGLKRDCSVRVYTRTPELFLGYLKATMVAVPEEVASQALGVRRDAILLDRSGGRLAGPAAEPPAVNYAEAVLKRALKIPEGLGLFSERFEARVSPRGLPDPQSVRAVEPTYNLAVALAGSVEDRRDLLLSYLPKVAQWLGPGEVWNRLISPEEWAAFPPEALQALLLRDLSSAPAGARELQGTVETILAGQGWRLDDRLDEWWDGADPGKVRKLVELLDRKLVTPAAVASRTSGLPLRCLPDAGVARAALAAEMSANVLSSRSSDPAGLADLAADQEIFSLLAEAVRKRALDAGWASELVRKTEDDGLVELARRLLPLPGFLLPGTWGDLPRRVVDRLCGRELPPDLRGLLFMAGKDLQPATDPGLYLRLVEALGATLPAGSENGLASRLLVHFPREVREEDVSRLFRIMDGLMPVKGKEATRALVESGWWFAWRQESKLDRDRLRDAAVEWITCDAWAKGPEAHLETWRIVLADLPAKLEEKALARRSWPWIPPFEEEQLGDLARRALDLGALAALAEAIRHEPCFRGAVAHVLVHKSSGFAGTFDDPAILSWLMPREPEGLQALDLAHSSLLYDQAGQRRQQALVARRRSVEAALETSRLLEALEAAGEPDLWHDPDFMTAVASWMSRRGSLADVGHAAARLIDSKAACKPSRPPQASGGLVQELSQAGYGNAAGLFVEVRSEIEPISVANVKPVQVTDSFIRALIENRSDDACWDRLVEQVRVWRERPGSRRHPLSDLAAFIRAQEPEIQDALRLDGWTTFTQASEGRDVFLSVGADYDGPLPVLELAASLQGPGTLGRAVVEVVKLKGNAVNRGTCEWWQALIRGIRGWRRWENVRSADDCSDRAMAILFRLISRMDEFDKERSIFFQAMRKEVTSPNLGAALP